MAFNPIAPWITIVPSTKKKLHKLIKNRENDGDVYIIESSTKDVIEKNWQMFF